MKRKASGYASRGQLSLRKTRLLRKAGAFAASAGKTAVKTIFKKWRSKTKTKQYKKRPRREGNNQNEGTTTLVIARKFGKVHKRTKLLKKLPVFKLSEFGTEIDWLTGSRGYIVIADLAAATYTTLANIMNLNSAASTFNYDTWLLKSLECNYLITNLGNTNVEAFIWGFKCKKETNATPIVDLQTGYDIQSDATGSSFTNWGTSLGYSPRLFSNWTKFVSRRFYLGPGETKKMKVFLSINELVTQDKAFEMAAAYVANPKCFSIIMGGQGAAVAIDDSVPSLYTPCAGKLGFTCSSVFKMYPVEINQGYSRKVIQPGTGFAKVAIAAEKNTLWETAATSVVGAFT